MSVATFEAVVENGQIRLPREVRLPENSVVYVVVPGYSAEEGEEAAALPALSRLASPILKRPEQAADFILEVVEEPVRADLR